MRERRNSAHGRESRELILETALAVIGRRGYGATSLRDIAAEVGMTQAGMLHHFGTKENLLVEVLRQRDAASRAALAEEQGDRPDGEPMAVRVARRNAHAPALVHLYVSLQAAAFSPEHPAHAFFRERQREIHDIVAGDIRSAQDAGGVAADVDADGLATVILALSDGLQAQQGVDPSIDIAGTLDWLWRRVAEPPAPPTPGPAVSPRPA